MSVLRTADTLTRIVSILPLQVKLRRGTIATPSDSLSSPSWWTLTTSVHLCPP